MDRREFLKSSIGCMCLALLPPFTVVCPPNRPPVLSDLDAFHRDWASGTIAVISYSEHVILKPLYAREESVWLGEHTSPTPAQDC